MEKIINTSTSTYRLQRWGGIASFLWAAVLIASGWLYLTGNLRDPWGPYFYDLADFMAGPVWAASLIVFMYALRERIGEFAPVRMDLALRASFISAGAMVAVACIRAANRHYHILHPDLHLETAQTVLVVWTTLISGITAAGYHFLGWAWVLIGSTAWTSRRLPPVLSLLYFLAGGNSMFVYLDPSLEGTAAFFSVVASIWLGFLFLIRSTPALKKPKPEPNTG